MVSLQEKRISYPTMFILSIIMSLLLNYKYKTFKK